LIRILLYDKTLYETKYKGKLMKTSLCKVILVNCMFYFTEIYGISLVYNLRIAEITKRQALEIKDEQPSIAGVILLGQFRKQYDGTRQTIGSGLATLIHAPQSLYVRVDFAGAYVSEKTNISYFSRTQTDDLLFTTGYTHQVSTRTKITISGLLGIPTHRDLSLEGIQFGTGHVSIGLQIDSSLTYLSDHRNHALMAAARYVRFFPRTAYLKTNNGNNRFDFDIGNLVDILIAHTSRWGNHGVEVGYGLTDAFGAHIDPPLDNVAAKTNFLRSSFYGNYKYLFLIGKLPSVIGATFSYGFDHTPKEFGNKRIITAWVGWAINF
jgi:hypothetical protein